MSSRLIKKVRAERKRRRLSIREAAPLIGVSFSTLARLERDGGDTTALTERRLRAWLGEDIEVVTLEERVADLEKRMAAVEELTDS